MKKIRELLFNRWVLGGLVVLLLSLVILLVGDAIAFFDWRPLDTLLSRWLTVFLLVLVWVTWEVVRAWRIRRANQSMLQGIAGADGEAESSARSAQEIATLQARFKEAVTVLRKARFKGRAGERQYLYQLPWYVIVGAPGSGKTTVGTLLARAWAVEARDTDADIVATQGRSIPDLFLEEGEAHFRELERAAVADALATHSGVLALGGGAVLDEQTRALLDGHRVVFLRVGLSDAVKRVGLGSGRPLLLGNVRSRIKALLDERTPVYEGVATLSVETDGRTPQDVAREIEEALA